MSQDPTTAAAAGNESAEPTCPRHPDVVSYVRCQRCERPVCPTCQRAAAVGVQCVDCVAEGAKSVRSATTMFGGKVRQGKPVVTLTIISLCVTVFILQLAVPPLTDQFSFIPGYARNEPWRFITSAFLHSTSFYMHILFNMYVLWLFGQHVEELLGRLRYIALYLVTAIGSGVAMLLWAPSVAHTQADASPWVSSAVGASGAVFGIWGALLLINRRLNRTNGGMIALLAINMAIGFIPGLNVAWQGHLGGFLTGLVMGAIYAYAPRQRRTLLHVVGVAAVVVGLATASVWKIDVSGPNAQLSGPRSQLCITSTGELHRCE